MSARNPVRPPSVVAVEHVEGAGGRLVEADLRAILTDVHGAAYARRAIEFAILRRALDREYVGHVAVVVVADNGVDR